MIYARAYARATNDELRRASQESPWRELLGSVMVLASSVVREQYGAETWARWNQLATTYGPFDELRYGVYDGYARLLKAKYGEEAGAHIPNDWTMDDVERLAEEVVVIWKLEGRTR